MIAGEQSGIELDTVELAGLGVGPHEDVDLHLGLLSAVVLARSLGQVDDVVLLTRSGVELVVPVGAGGPLSALVEASRPAELADQNLACVGFSNAQRRSGEVAVRLWLKESAVGLSVRAVVGGAALSVPVTLFLHRLRQLLRSVATRPDGDVRHLSIVASEEHAWLDAATAGPVINWPEGGASLQELVFRQAAATPHRIAVQAHDGSLTYGGLAALAAKTAERLEAVGVRPGVAVAVIAERGVALLPALLGILKAGGAFLPVDPTYPAARVRAMLHAAEVSVVMLADRHVWDVGDNLRQVSLLSMTGISIEGKHAPIGVRRMSPKALDGTYVLFTSGSTGTPKGSLVGDAAIVNRLLWMQDRFRLSKRDVVVQKTPLTFDVSVWELFWPLLAGARLAMPEPGMQRDPERLAAFLLEHRVSVVHFVPSMLEQFVEEPLVPEIASLRLVISSGEALTTALADRVLKRTRAELHNLYGPTEAAIDVTAWHCGRGGSESAIVPIGTPIANVLTEVLDPGGARAPVGAWGELFLGGACVALRYVGAPDLTKERFVSLWCRPDSDGLWFRTGDVARWSIGGHLEFRGRLDRQVKLRGMRVELEEVEAVLVRATPVRAARALLRHAFGSDKLVAYVVLDGTTSSSDLRKHCASWLPDQMVPAFIVVVPQLPLSRHGKFEGEALPDPTMADR